MTAETESTQRRGTIRDPIGWAQVVGLAVGAYILGELVGPVNAVIAALLLGILAGNFSPIVTRSDTVSTFMLKRVLKFAIILLGAGVDATLLSRVNVSVVLIILAAIVLSLIVARVVGPALGLSRDTSMLIGVGTSICGASAIAAVAPILRAKQVEVGFALGTIFVFNAIAMLTYPLLGFALDMDPFHFGAWAGIAVHDTASAVATGFAYGTEAGETATLVKLTRTLFLVPLVVVLAISSSVGDSADSDASLGRSIVKSFPLFVLGFIATAAANTLGILGDLGSWISDFGKLLVVGVVVAIGLSLRFDRIKALGPALAITGLIASLVVAGVAFGLVTKLL